MKGAGHKRWAIPYGCIVSTRHPEKVIVPFLFWHSIVS